jgi:epoxyqueuosine reductase
VDEVLDLIGAGVQVDEWGVARNPGWPLAPDLPFAVALVGRHSPAALDGLERTHMSQAFFDDYARLFAELDEAAAALVMEVERRGYTAVQTGNVMAGPHDDPPLEDWGDAGVFPHKTAATQAGLGWIGKTAVFVSIRFGAAVRLTSVFTDLPLTPGEPVVASRCGDCRLCVDACPQAAGNDVIWRAGMARDELYDEKACEAKTYEHPEWDGTCGVCQAVCPYTRRAARLVPWRDARV